MKASKVFDIAIIGAGQAGVPLARKMADEGRRVVIAERAHFGGSCVNFGCTPTKAVIASARLAHLARRAADFGLSIPTVAVDFPAVLRRAKAIVEESRQSLEKGLAECGAEVLRSHCRLTGRDGDLFELSAGDMSFRARAVVLNTGTRTRIPPIDGLKNVDFLHAGNWLESTSLPGHVIFIGGGVISLEMAQFYRRLGSRVEVIVSGDRIAEREDVDVSRAMRQFLEAEGVSFHFNAKVRKVERERGGIRIGTEAGDVTGTHLFIATGRQPNTDDLGLERVGLKPRDDGTIEVDDRLSSPVPGIYAAGDIRGGPMFTHTSWDDHRVLESQLLGDGSHTIQDRIVPYAIFIDPELGRVGLTEKEARAKFGEHVIVATFPMLSNGKAKEIGEDEGFIKLVADSRDGRLLGAAALTADGAELVGSYITLMNAGVTLDAICRGIFIHPTLSEAVQSAAMSLNLRLSPLAK